ncbi:MAG: hypothetical protein M1816_008086 [Peltula sp. TS41687]|nr:MAG: hypothetical protein M1816_008086 [Peltula sp. TS41687]
MSPATDPNPKSGAYGPNSSTEPSFRRTWDRAAYAAQAAARSKHEAAEGRARYEAKLAGHKYHPPPPPPSTSSSSSFANPNATNATANPNPSGLTTARTTRLDVSAQIGKTVMITGAMAGVVGKRGRSAGFYCAWCDLTFKDNVQLVEHENSRGHLVAVGQSGEVVRASLEEVRERLRVLKEMREREQGEMKVGLKERLRGAEEREERERGQKREMRRVKRRRKQGGGEGGGGLEEVEVVEDDGLALMGLSGFGSTKV